MAATTAVVAGTAGAVSHHQQQKYANQAAEQQQQQYDQQQAAAAAAAPPPAAAPSNDIMTQLNQLAAMHTAGVLTDEEFAAGKAKLLDRDLGSGSRIDARGGPVACGRSPRRTPTGRSRAGSRSGS